MMRQSAAAPIPARQPRTATAVAFQMIGIASSLAAAQEWVSGLRIWDDPAA
ncbi:hypothetical protein ACH4UM_40665 [Streptomyces sp. NPDC020801]|uniref:hypothetical protein n=1 Tax=unclassified Streptomyces TaxID=2593676 RepID=UPI0037922956